MLGNGVSTMFSSMLGEIMGSFISCDQGVVLGEVVSNLLSSMLGRMVASLFNCK